MFREQKYYSISADGCMTFYFFKRIIHEVKVHSQRKWNDGIVE
jgi:hypothetical protein